MLYCCEDRDEDEGANFQGDKTCLLVYALVLTEFARGRCDAYLITEKSRL